MGYLANFIVYTLAMVGVIVVALLVFKNSTGCGVKNSGKFLKVVDSMSLAPRKNLYIVQAGGEKFLIASDVDKTSLISKLETQGDKSSEVPEIKETFKETIQNTVPKSSYIDRGSLGICKTQDKPYESVIKNLAVRMRGG